MKLTEQVALSFGTLERLMGGDGSAVLTQLSSPHYPDPEPACATCPGADWYLTVKHLRCFCKENRFISWVSNDDPVMACDARERLIEEAQAEAHPAESVKVVGQ